jgi:hypothetical protein
MPSTPRSTPARNRRQQRDPGGLRQSLTVLANGDASPSFSTTVSREIQGERRGLARRTAFFFPADTGSEVGGHPCSVPRDAAPAPSLFDSRHRHRRAVVVLVDTAPPPGNPEEVTVRKQSKRAEEGWLNFGVHEWLSFKCPSRYLRKYP